METQTKLVINLKQNPAVAEACAGKSVGDKFPVEFPGATLSEVNAENIVLDLDAAVPEGYEVSEPEEANVAMMGPSIGLGTGAADQTIPSAIASMVRRKS
jgi:hypothetical protein